eukprot:6207342-Pleurochrysis_carterae.AAC.2
MKVILKTIDNVATRSSLRNSPCGVSVRELICIITCQTDNVPASTVVTIQSMMQAPFDDCLEE